MNTNRLVLSGKICNAPIKKVSPAGVPHCQLVIEHRSQQQESGFVRQVWCRITIIASGKKLQQVTHSVTVGSRITVIGFISSHKGANGLTNLVIHAEQIKLIDSGDYPNGTLFPSS
ncbi:Primosomal replication protein n [Arsenophonus endosymbiont of Aleurodicus dispersus]|uniref:primosomal replication protein N n=1 Tax=Arsenophonus endosymbiont of Aleurodicus dispersus TaxID=235559 RepID=UPI000EAB5434|nr:primosomal replication protein N [Arsenophonus endosymbiont of Aleurodicus dispersus]VAY02404.1 Primosomal replication protein n [Arsenophonus endosymbiont of Aleurodicus dispersus]